MKYLFILFLLIAFLLGIFFCMSSKPLGDFITTSDSMNAGDSTTTKNVTTESMTDVQDAVSPKMISNANENSSNPACANVLIRKGNQLFLYNSYQSQTNPKIFSDLDEYTKYVEEQRNQGVRCPVLFLQEENDLQGNNVYRVRPSPYSLEGGLPPVQNAAPTIDASRENPPYNSGQYSGFDPYGRDIGIYNELDKIHDSTEQTNISDNPMDTNWGGVLHTQQAVDSGKYDEYTVGKPTMIPKVLAIRG
jgi:hypothetical protein